VELAATIQRTRNSFSWRSSDPVASGSGISEFASVKTYLGLPGRGDSACIAPKLIHQSNFLHRVTPVWLEDLSAAWQHAAEAPAT
jgi:hypothetical protein